MQDRTEFLEDLIDGLVNYIHAAKERRADDHVILFNVAHDLAGAIDPAPCWSPRTASYVRRHDAERN